MKEMHAKIVIVPGCWNFFYFINYLLIVNFLIIVKKPKP